MPGGTTNAACPREPSAGSTEAVTTCTVGDAAVGGVRLLAVEDPLVGGLVVDGPGAHRADVRAGLRLGGAERGDLRLGRRRRSTAAPTRRAARACRSRRSRRPPGRCRRCAMPMPASPQNSSSLAIGKRQPGRVGPAVGEELEAVQADLRRLLDDRPGRLLALVPLGRGRAHDVGGEAVHPVAQVPLLLVQVERELDATRRGQAFGMSKRLAMLAARPRSPLALSLPVMNIIIGLRAAGDDLEEVDAGRR